MAALKRLKVAPKILTGDQAAIAVSVCRRVGISAETVLTGAKLDEMTDSELRTAVEEIHVFAELTPGQKVRLVSALRENGHSVGFLGDGVNDIPALCEANVGISVDTAVDAAKDAADVVAAKGSQCPGTRCFGRAQDLYQYAQIHQDHRQLQLW